MFGVPVTAHAEETADVVHGADESTLKWYISQDGFDQIRLGMVCGSCLEPFPAAPEARNAKVWRDHAHHYAGIRSAEELMALVTKGRCPVCQSEVSMEMTNATHRGKDEFEPEDGAY
jgi:hypothetical protein